MKKGYWVVAYRSISDASAVKAYGGLAVRAMTSPGRLTKARLTKRRFRHSAPARSATSASWKVRR